MPRLTPTQCAVAGAALVLLLQAIPAAGPLLEYRRALLPAEPWRLLSAHLVHVNAPHAFVNAAAWVLLARLFTPELNAHRQLWVLAIGAAFISAALAVLYPTIAWYRGASGALHALFFAGAAAAMLIGLRQRALSKLLWAAALMVGGAFKIAIELPGGAATPYAHWLGSPTVPQAHLVGAIVGSSLGLLFGRRPRASLSG